MITLPFLWKTEVIVVEDDEYFAEEACDHLQNSPFFSAKPFSYPKQALEYVKNSKEHCPHLTETYDQGMAVDFDAIYQIMESDEKPSSISVLVVDYHMPGCTGIEFFEQLKLTNYKKIILTAMLDPSDAIEHKGELFDDYMQKAEGSRVFNRLREKVEKQVHRYFYSIAYTVIWCLHHTAPNSLIFSKEFAEYFNKILEELNIIEYYIVDSVGSFNLKSKNKQYLLYVQSEEDMKATITEYANIEDDNIRQDIEGYKVVPGILEERNKVIFPAEYELRTNLHPVENVIKHRGNNYYIVLLS